MALTRTDDDITPLLPRAERDIIEEILDMTNAEFKDLVDTDIRSDPDDENAEEILPAAYRDALRSRAVCERWYQTLVRLKKSTELTIAAKRSDDKRGRIELLSRGNSRKADTVRRYFLQWHAGAIRYLTGVEIRLTEANYWRRVHFGSDLPSHIVAERDELSIQMRMLQEAIIDHREDFNRSTATAADEALWAVLDDI